MTNTKQPSRSTNLPPEWVMLVTVCIAFEAAEDATDSVFMQHIDPSTPYNKVLSIHQSWKNKYARCAAHGLITTPYRIRRRRTDDGGYDIEAVQDMTAKIENAMIVWPDE